MNRVKGLKGKKKSNLESNIRLGIPLIFSIFWFSFGFELVENTGLFSDFINNYAGNETSIFTMNTLIFGTFYFAVLSYPTFTVFFLSITLFDNDSFFQLITKKGILYFLLSPLAWMLLIVFYVFIGRIVIHALTWILFLGYPFYLMGKWIYGKLKN